MDKVETLQTEQIVSDDNKLASIRASTGQRFSTLLLDLIFVYALSFLLGIILVIVGLERIIADTNDYVFGMILMLIYYVSQEGTSGKTLGKRIVGTRAVSLDGTAVTVPQSIARTLCRFIPFEVFSFLGGNGHPWGWHDKFSNTQVVVSKKFVQISENAPSVRSA